MELIFKVVATCVAAAVLSAGIRKTVPDIALLVQLAAAAISFLLAFRALTPVFAFLKEAATVFETSGVYYEPVLKTALIGVVTGVGTAVCKDTGQASAETAVGLVGTITALYTALPIFQLFVHTIGELL